MADTKLVRKTRQILPFRPKRCKWRCKFWPNCPRIGWRRHSRNWPARWRQADNLRSRRGASVIIKPGRSVSCRSARFSLRAALSLPVTPPLSASDGLSPWLPARPTPPRCVICFLTLCRPRGRLQRSSRCASWLPGANDATWSGSKASGVPINRGGGASGPVGPTEDSRKVNRTPRLRGENG